jgi:hypothetical protein
MPELTIHGKNNIDSITINSILPKQGLATGAIQTPCCSPRKKCKANLLAPIYALTGIFTPTTKRAIQIDSGRLKSSVISRDLAMQLRAQGEAYEQVPVTLRPGVGGFDN